MSKSFDDILKDRLGGFEKRPPADAKAAVIGQFSKPESNVWDRAYNALAAVLILLSLYQVGKKENLGTNELVDQKNTPVVIAQKSEMLDAEEKQTRNRDRVQNISKPEILGQQAVKNGPPKTAEIIQVARPKREIKMVDIHGESYGLLDQELLPLTELENKRRKSYRKIVPQERKHFYPYFNAGGFFIYNRVKPNLADEIYVGEYESPFGVSPSRIGLVLEGGLHKEWSERFSTRVGLVVNNFNQSYSFTVRSTKPDSVSISGADGILQPHFNKENVKINKRVSLIGVKGQMLWHVFPTYANVLFASFEYQHLIGNGPRFTYKDENYNLMRPSQYLTEIGLRKLMWEGRRGDIFLMPGLRYAVNKFGNEGVISVKPFSVGVTVSYGLK